MSRTLWAKVNYRSPMQFIIDIPIREYDISKANISVLRDANAISESEYNYLYNCPKEKRNTLVGLMISRNTKIEQVRKTGIESARKTFMEINNLDDKDILAIRNDSLMVLSDRPMILDITERVKFRLEGSYRSFYHLGFVDYYYDFNPITNTEILDIKGLGEEGIALHEKYMLDFLKELFYTAQIEGIPSAISLLSNFYNNYIRRRLDVGYYRELNSRSNYKLNINSIAFAGGIELDKATRFDLRDIDINYNLNILLTLNKIFSSVYFK